jgi:signal transduction histidine kinase
MARAGLEHEDPPRRLITIADEDADGPFFSYFGALRRQGRPPVFLGLNVDLDRMGERLVEPPVRAAERQALTGLETEARLGVRVQHPSGRVVFEQGRPGSGPTYVLDLFGPDLTSTSAERTRPFDAALSIPPELLPHFIPGGMPGSPWPLVGAAVGLAGLLSLLAALLIWRIREIVLLRERFVASVSHELRTPVAQRA